MMQSSRHIAGAPGFIAVNRRELDAHAPLSWPLFDADGTPLLAQGECIPSEADLDWLFTMFAPHRPLPDIEPGEAGDGAESASMTYLHGLPVPLPIGAWLQVRVAPGAELSRVRARLVGRAPNGMLLITPPTGGEARLPVVAGDRLALWTFPGDNLYEFVCDVHSVHRAPFEYLVLSRPMQVRETPVRRTPRVDTRLVARVSPVDESGPATFQGMSAQLRAAAALGRGDDGEDGASPDAPEWLVMVRDISAEGVGIMAQSPLPAGCRHVALQFRVPVGADIVPVFGMAAIRRTEGPCSDGSWLYGLEFTRIDARNRAAVRCFVYELRLADPRARG
ncbi:flagellar brake protein [Pandoraea terrae]|uniref:Flagellar brake protein n=1 Tax=Pandoraea terrae TaxID=1537710 RepID=A0A5E4UC98_9BURK|nr:flagellar brake protein [Pandoraea terrae]VVD97293.1 flagellar brake protein [Pandoraea terrae]